jgi:hypothetical protein
LSAEWAEIASLIRIVSESRSTEKLARVASIETTRVSTGATTPPAGTEITVSSATCGTVTSSAVSGAPGDSATTIRISVPPSGPWRISTASASDAISARPIRRLGRSASARGLIPAP